MFGGYHRIIVFGVLHRLAFQSDNGASHRDQLSTFVHFRIEEFLAAGDESPGSIGKRQWLAITAQGQFQNVDSGAIYVVDRLDDSAAPDDDGSLASAGIGCYLRQGQRFGLLLEVFGDGISHAT